MIVGRSFNDGAEPLPRCLVFVVAMLGMFAAGILLGELSAGNVERLARISGAIATIVVLWVGVGMVVRMRGHHPLLAVTVAALIAANISYTVAAFTPPVVNVLFDFGTLMVMLLLRRVGACGAHVGRLCLHLPRSSRVGR